ncbi:MAG: hypothetical protein ACUBOA_08285 [Candidatus Loosdrechtia sp.]|uniref:hypothetical protein n=1 Tax=Candidatus Loosdrechtia sp. TaxID=3101272 RepID=UPI003A611266|nr:MAG: hypothetical protein QY305_06190 [Candidatus Jettenia sp. AMX2]
MLVFSQTNKVLPDEWTTFSKIVSEFYGLEGINSDQKAAETRKHINKQLPVLLHSQNHVGVEWGELRKGIIEKKCELIQSVLKSKISVF